MHVAFVSNAVRTQLHSVFVVAVAPVSASPTSLLTGGPGCRSPIRNCGSFPTRKSTIMSLNHMCVAFCSAICVTNPKACPARCVGSTDKHHTVCLESGDLDDDCCGLKGTISCLPGYGVAVCTCGKIRFTHRLCLVCRYTFARGKRCMPDVDGLGLRYKTQCTKLTCAECQGRQRLGENIACTMCNVMPVPGQLLVFFACREKK